MPLYTTEGIIVRRSNFGEADRMLTVITPFKGKIKVVAKGVRRITSKRGGNVELLNKVKLHIFQNKGMPILTEAESIETFPKIKNDLTFSTYGSHIAELAERFLPEDQPNPAAFNLLATALHLLETNPRQLFIRAYEIKLLTILGYWGVKEIEVIEEIRDILEELQVKSWEEIEKMKINKNQALELEQILRYYIEKVLESSLKSLKMMDKIKLT